MRYIAALLWIASLSLPIRADDPRGLGQLPGAQIVDGKLNFGVVKPGIPDLKGVELRLADIVASFEKWAHLPDRLEAAAWSGAMWGTMIFWGSVCGTIAFIIILARRP